MSDTIVYTMPVADVDGPVEVGNVVSLTKDGKLRRGEGTTITKNIQKWEKELMTHVASTNIGANIVASAYDGYMMVTYVNDDGKVTYNERFDLPLAGKQLRRPDDIATLDSNTVVIVGNTEIVPITVEWDGKKAKVTPGQSQRFTEPESFQPVMDTVGDKCVAIGYFYYHNATDSKLGTRTACLTGEGEKKTFELSPENLYSDNYYFHAIAGLSATKYVLAKAGDATGMNDIIFQLATITNGTIKVGKELRMMNRTNYGFFDMDNLNDHQIIVTFIDGNLDNGLESILLVYSDRKDVLIIGPYLDNQDGGASGASEMGVYNFIHVRVLSESRFGVFYSNLLNQGSTALCLGEVTPANDLIAVGPEYILSATMTDPNNEYYWLGETAVHRNRLILVESLSSKNTTNNHSEMHVVDIKALPLGVVIDKDSSKVKVAVSGMVKVPGMILAPGRNYYGDTHGDLIKGEYVGSMNTDSYYVYVESEEGVMVSDDNRVGFAMDANTLFLKVHN